MRSNDDILVNYESEYVNHEKTLFAWATCDSAMKEAQVEAIKELVKLKWDDTNNMFMGGTGYPSKSLDQLALELIKEIEG